MAANTGTSPKTPFLSQFLLSSTLQLPSTLHVNPRRVQHTLLSTRDPLSIQISTANFRKFVTRVGPVFWLQDRIEEILFWKKGWKPTAVWMAVYAFFCYFPRLLLLVPLLVVLSIIISTYPQQADSMSKNKSSTAPLPNVVEGSVDWQANLQAIQNLMGAYIDLHDAILPYVAHLTHGTSSTGPLLTGTLLALAALIPIIQVLPFFPLFLFLGLGPFFLTHPIILARLRRTPTHNLFPTTLLRVVDDDHLTDRHWRSELRTVELWENERFSWPSPAGSDADGWGKGNLRPSERAAWTRGRDGWSGVSSDGSGQVSNLTFPLPSGWHFVETEDWRPDTEGSWIAPLSCDINGWVYTNDSWLDPRPAPADEWKTHGATRRRRWLHRIYYNPPNEH